MCCLFGLVDYNNCLSVRHKEKIIKVLSKECEARGTDATGVAYIADDKIYIYKRPLPAHRMKFIFKGNPPVIMGHTRMTTQGSEKNNINNHPFYSEKLGFALAHNGVLYNDKALRKSEKIPSTKIETDSYIAVQFIEKQKALNFETIKYMAEKVEGSFCFTILNKDNELYIIKGDNPMCIAHFNGFYMYASTDVILNKALNKLGLKHYKNIKIADGEILKFNNFGNITKAEFDNYNSCYGYPWLYGYKKSVSEKAYKDEYIEGLICYGKTVGVSEETIIEMLELGYDYMDIEEMLYDFDYYEEDCYYDEI